MDGTVTLAANGSPAAQDLKGRGFLCPIGCGWFVMILADRRTSKLLRQELCQCPFGYGSQLDHQGTAGFSLCFHLPGFHFGYLFLTHTHLFSPLQFVHW